MRGWKEPFAPEGTTFMSCARDSFREFHVDRDSSDPMHRQLYAFLRRAIVAGEIRAAARLPSSRALARILGVSRNTVLNAYEALAVDGFLAGRIGSGTRVRHPSDPIAHVPYPQTIDPRRILRDSHYPLGALSFSDPDGNAIFIHR